MSQKEALRIERELLCSRVEAIEKDIMKLHEAYARQEKAHSDLIQGKADSLMALVRKYLVPGIGHMIHEKVREYLADTNAIYTENDIRDLKQKVGNLEAHNERITKIIGEKFFEDLFKETEKP